MSNSTNTILIWDSESDPPKDFLVFHWRRYSESDNVQSILKAIENDSDNLRKEYLKFIYDLGELNIKGKRIVEYLEMEPGFSLWWMSLLAEKNYLKSQSIFNCIRFLALRNLLVKYSPESVLLVSTNSDLLEAMESLCISLAISFSWNPTGLKRESSSIRDIRKWVPTIVKAPIFLAHYLIKRWTLRRVKDENWFSGSNSIFILSYFIHLDRKSCTDGKYFSHQWEVLPEYLHKYGKRINWIHHFLFSPTVPNTTTGIKWLKSFNQNANSQGFHQFLESFLSIKIVIKTLNNWFKSVWRIFWINKKLNESINTNPLKWLWPFLRDDWKRSAYGVVAMQNLIWVALFDKALASIPRQDLGMYLCENQGWERAFIHFWKKHGHGELIAVPHSTIRYWDLRYFEDFKVWHSKDILAQPMPNKIALNGNAAWKAYQKAKQPMEIMVKVEALRYLALNNIKRKNRILNKDHINKNLLIIGDYVSEMTNRGLDLLNKLDISIISKYKIHFKSHPATPIKLKRFNNLINQTTNNPLSQILPTMDVVIATSSTAGAIEPFVLGIPVIIIIDSCNLNTSPLRGEPGVSFIRTTEELQQALLNVNSEILQYKPDAYFWTDPELPRWKTLLNLN